MIFASHLQHFGFYTSTLHVIQLEKVRCRGSVAMLLVLLLVLLLLVAVLLLRLKPETFEVHGMVISAAGHSHMVTAHVL